MKPEKERAILVALSKKDVQKTLYSLDELRRLAETAGAEVVDAVYQSRPVEDPGYYVGYGFAEELGFRCREEQIDLVIFDDELSFFQERNLEELTQTKIINRTMVILDIFASRARTHEGKLQVECAQLEYMFPRLLGMGKTMSRLGGGIGTRGPGETKLEVDRRRIKRRIKILKDAIGEIRKTRNTQRNKRKNIPTVALVGYTNAGKSTLINAVTDSQAYVEDKLFSTLDPLIRKYTEQNLTVLFSDTVGFIKKIPHQLVDAFHATLEEVAEADLLLHVVDATDPEMEDKITAVDKTLREIKVFGKKIIQVFNKCDCEDSFRNLKEEGWFISAKENRGVGELVHEIMEHFYGKYEIHTLSFSGIHGDLLAFIHENSQVISKQVEHDQIIVKFQSYHASFRKIKRMYDMCEEKIKITISEY